MNFTPDIRLFSCHYTCQQTSAMDDNGLQNLDFPKNITINRVVCTGKIEITTLLQAFEDGADGVYVVGCPKDTCHNIKGSQRAAKRVETVRSALTELAVEPDRIKMFHTPRGLHHEFIEAAHEMNGTISELGPTPF